ncbi:hypothetical protein SLNWT_0832 [Streptomyces albus]|uniref:Uncharacterized protein n=1 Tax=Streptomyces albus (strain ATCC 21838 / DSM 41398 / FERM P-419 / JCM 4703 / NBRC 107858) TaxID=1081613 RepID=A0A0B5EGG2_STRA4|nr:hypothetical protein SLNWT_0832 [Streptomyces albus]AOU75522.1 hypothetical protein SLNHY_0831 [Streptomyces albus]AYN31325.1 hypothetical protein DUI70_0822 [Streptomyces albus]
MSAAPARSVLALPGQQRSRLPPCGRSRLPESVALTGELRV